MNPGVKTFIIVLVVLIPLIFIVSFFKSASDNPPTGVPSDEQATVPEDETSLSVPDYFASFFKTANPTPRPAAGPVPPTGGPSGGQKPPQAQPPPPPASNPTPPAGGPQSVEITAPSAREILTASSMYKIRWSPVPPTGGPEVRISVYESPVTFCGYDKSCASSASQYVKNFILSENTTNTGEFSWKVELPSGKYHVRVETLEGALLGDSEVFAVASANETAKIEIAYPYDPSTMPYEAELPTYIKGSSVEQAMMWDASAGIFYVDIFIKSKSTSAIYQIARDIPNAKIFGWNPDEPDVLGSSIPAGEYEIFIQDAGSSHVKSNIRNFILE